MAGLMRVRPDSWDKFETPVLAGTSRHFWLKRRSSAGVLSLRFDRMREVLVIWLLSALFASNPASAQNAPVDFSSKAYWQSITRNDYRVPEGADTMAHMRALVALVSSTDPQWRDDIGYEIFWRWVRRSGRLDAVDLDALRAALLPTTSVGLGETESDRVFTRSFSILFLSELANADIKTPFLSDATFAELLTLACDALAKEKDLRGYVPGKGWAHATGHTADLLKALAKNPRLHASQAATIVAAIVERARTVPAAFAWGEDERLGNALAMLAFRTDAAVEPFERWLSSLQKENKTLWSVAFDVTQYRRVRTQVSLLTNVAAIMATLPATPTSMAISKLIANTLKALQ